MVVVQKKIIGFLALLLMINISWATPPTLSIAVAANFQETLQKLVHVFEQENNVHFIISSASTGELFAQIMQSAPYDMAFLADKKHAILLEKSKKALMGTRWTYAIGQLVLWKPEATDANPANESDLDHFSEGNIALANPDFAPYGFAAQQVLKKRNCWEKLYSHFVFGNSVSQAYHFVATGNAKIGFVAYSEVIDKPGIWIIPQSLYTPLTQQAVILPRAKNNPMAWKFKQFLQSESAKTLIKRDGYDL